MANPIVDQLKTDPTQAIQTAAAVVNAADQLLPVLQANPALTGVAIGLLPEKWKTALQGHEAAVVPLLQDLLPTLTQLLTIAAKNPQVVSAIVSAASH